METGNTHHSLEAEELAEQILLVTPEELEEFLNQGVVESTLEWAAGNLGKQRIRAIKNGLITLITCVCRAAIKYGVDPEFAYTLSDYYIEYLETLNSAHKLAELMRQILFHHNALVSSARAPSYSRQINRAVEYIGRNLYSPIRVQDVAEYVKLEPHYFAARFKAEVQMSPSRYILLKKLEVGKEMLRKTRNSVTYIALALGFCDVSHFEKRFKAEFGMPPGEYRNN